MKPGRFQTFSVGFWHRSSSPIQIKFYASYVVIPISKAAKLTTRALPTFKRSLCCVLSAGITMSLVEPPFEHLERTRVSLKFSTE